MVEHLDGQLPRQDPRQFLKNLKSDYPLGYALTEMSVFPRHRLGRGIEWLRWPIRLNI